MEPTGCPETSVWVCQAAQEGFFLDCLTLEEETDRWSRNVSMKLSLRCVISPNSADRTYTAAEVWNHVSIAIINSGFVVVGPNNEITMSYSNDSDKITTLLRKMFQVRSLQLSLMLQ
jgi:hypothetical protein